MATELMERMVIRRFDEIALDYSVLRDDIVVVELPSEAAGTIQVVISDQEETMGVDMLNAVVLGIVKFPESQMRRALDLCNALNLRPIGKFIVDNEGLVSYWLDWPVPKSAEPEDVSLMLWLLVGTIDARYSDIMEARWGSAED